jgi:hypothetical protein
LTTGPSSEKVLFIMGMFSALSVMLYARTRADEDHSQGTIEELATIQVVEGQSRNIEVIYTNTFPHSVEGKGVQSQQAVMRGLVRFFL